MNTLFTLLLVALIVAGMLIVANGVGIDIIGEATKTASNCYDLLNAAGQVVGQSCH